MTASAQHSCRRRRCADVRAPWPREANAGLAVSSDELNAVSNQLVDVLYKSIDFRHESNDRNRERVKRRAKVAKRRSAVRDALDANHVSKARRYLWQAGENLRDSADLDSADSEFGSE